MASTSTLTIEINSDQTARVRLSGYTTYGIVQPNEDGTFSVYLDDHLTGEKSLVTTMISFATQPVSTSLLEKAKAEGIDVTGLTVVFD